MMFASKTPRDLNLNHDPEFDHVQHNPPNPILVNLRQRIALGFDDAEEFGWWLEHEYNHDTDSWVWSDLDVREAHVDHARRVLSRLATLTEEGA